MALSSFFAATFASVSLTLGNLSSLRIIGGHEFDEEDGDSMVAPYSHEENMKAMPTTGTMTDSSTDLIMRDIEHMSVTMLYSVMLRSRQGNSSSCV
jgi:hypothetical protein